MASSSPWQHKFEEFQYCIFFPSPTDFSSSLVINLYPQVQVEDLFQTTIWKFKNKMENNEFCI